MSRDPNPRFQADSALGEQFKQRVLHRSWDARLKETVETPGRLAAIIGGFGGLILAVLYGLLIGGTDLQTVAVLSSLLVFTFLLVIAGEFWWALLVMATVSGLSTSKFGFRMTGFELGFVAVGVAYLIRMTLRAMQRFRPSAGLSLPFWALFLYLLIHTVLVITYHRYEDPSSLKNIVRGCYSVIAPLAFFFLLGNYCNPRTVKPVIYAFLMATAVTTFVAIPIWLLTIDLNRFEEMPFEITWLSPFGALAQLRTGPILANFAVALLLVAKTVPRRWLMLCLLGLAVVGAAASSGRLAFVGVFLVVACYLALNRKWLACMGCASVVGVLILISTSSPELVSSLPDSMQRALSPLNLGHSYAKEVTESSDRWHREIRDESFRYWTETWATFLFGHGYGGWDYSLSGDDNWNRDFDYAVKVAVQMGRTENVFSGITNIFGLTGLLLYSWFAWTIFKQTWQARKLTKPQSFEKAMCDVSLVYLAMFVVLSPFAGAAPGWDLFYWQLGLLATRPLIARKETKELDLGPVPSSRRPGDGVLTPQAIRSGLLVRNPRFTNVFR